MAGAINPYAVRRYGDADRTAPGPVLSLLPHAAYTVPDIPNSTDPDYTDGYATPLHTGPASTPDDIRVGRRNPPLNDPNDPRYNAVQEADFLDRHSVEKTVTGWSVEQHKLPAGSNPLWTQERMPIRPTATKSPDGYRFTRPWHIPRNIKDVLGEDATTHVSLASHRRSYPIGGMKPQGILGENTFRIQPAPWDQNLTATPRVNATDPAVMSPVWDNQRYSL